jgi:hypothetical protein
MEVRLAPAAEQAIQRAMAITGLDAGDLACQAARRAGRDTQRRAAAATVASDTDQGNRAGGCLVVEIQPKIPETRSIPRRCPEFRF